jgi:pyruvate,water dikinase
MMVRSPLQYFPYGKIPECGITAFSIGSNDLTQLILGIDRDSAKLASTFDERIEAVLIALEELLPLPEHGCPPLLSGGQGTIGIS